MSPQPTSRAQPTSSSQATAEVKSVKKHSAYRFSVADNYKALLRVVAKFAVWVAPNYPNFLCIGAPRSGTSWLFRNLRPHPRVYLPWFKEVHFLDEPIATHSVPPGKKFFDLTSEAAWRWYSLIFRPGKNLIKGDITPAYMLLSDARISEVKARMPDAKLIFIMRNPIERAWSGARRSLWADRGLKPSDVVDAQLLEEAALAPAIVDRGDYKGCIERWEVHYAQDQIMYLFFEDLTLKPRQELDRLLAFLQLSDYAGIEQLDLEGKVNSAPFEPPPDWLKDKLNELYEPQIAFLSERFGRDLTHWRLK